MLNGLIESSCAGASTALAEALRARGVPFILSTAAPAEELTEPAFGGAPIIRKPANLGALRTALEELSAGR